jgi:hypothetical protein
MRWDNFSCFVPEEISAQRLQNSLSGAAVKEEKKNRKFFSLY